MLAIEYASNEIVNPLHEIKDPINDITDAPLKKVRFDDNPEFENTIQFIDLGKGRNSIISFITKIKYELMCYEIFCR